MTKLAHIIATLLLTFATICLWSATTQAATWEEGTCKARPMVQGRAGEWVTTCELRRVPTKVTAAPSSKARARKGTTTVVARLGVRGTGALALK